MYLKLTKIFFSVLAAQEKLPDSRFESTARKCCLKMNGQVTLCGSRKKGHGLFRANFRVLPAVTKGDVNVFGKAPTLQLYHQRFGHQDRRHVK